MLLLSSFFLFVFVFIVSLAVVVFTLQSYDSSVGQEGENEFVLFDLSHQQGESRVLCVLRRSSKPATATSSVGTCRTSTGKSTWSLKVGV